MNKELAVEKLNKLYRMTEEMERVLITQDYLAYDIDKLFIQRFFENEKTIIQDTILAVITEEEEEAE